MEDLRYVLMVCVLHVLKLSPWSRCVHKFPCASRVRRYLAVSCFQGCKIWALSSLLTWEYSTSGLWVVCTSFLVLVELPCPSSTFSRSTACPKFYGGFSLVLHGLRHTKLTGFAFTGIIGLGFAIGEPSTGTRFLTSLWHDALLSDRIRKKINEMAAREHRETHHIEPTKNLIRIVTRETHFGWHVSKLVFGVNIFGSDLRFQNEFCRTTNQTQLCGSWIHVSLLDFVRPLMITLMTASLSSKTFNWDTPWEECVLVGTESTFDNCSTSRFLFSVGEWFPAVQSLPCLAVLFVERNTSITMSQRSRASSPSIRSPASNETIFDSVELWDTDVCFLHIQLMGTNARLPNIHKTPPEVDLRILTVAHKVWVLR